MPKVGRKFPTPPLVRWLHARAQNLLAKLAQGTQDKMQMPEKEVDKGRGWYNRQLVRQWVGGMGQWGVDWATCREWGKK